MARWLFHEVHTMICREPNRQIACGADGVPDEACVALIVCVPSERDHVNCDEVDRRSVSPSERHPSIRLLRNDHPRRILDLPERIFTCGARRGSFSPSVLDSLRLAVAALAIIGQLRVFFVDDNTTS